MNLAARAAQRTADEEARRNLASFSATLAAVK
jgi:hypothetical protein